MAEAGVLVPREFYNDLKKMWSEWRRSVKNPSPPQRARYPVGGGLNLTWIGRLQGSLAYGSSATVMLKKWDSGSSSFIDDTTATCYPFMMNTGDSIAANVQVVGGTVGGQKVVFNAACKNIYGS